MSEKKLARCAIEMQLTSEKEKNDKMEERLIREGKYGIAFKYSERSRDIQRSLSKHDKMCDCIALKQ